MTSTELISNNKSEKSKKISFHTAFWSNFNMNLKSLKKILIVMCVLHILGLPLFMISGISYEISDNYAMEGFLPLSFCCLVIALLIGFIIALNSFDYLYKRSKVDMIYALPLTIKQRFLSDYFSGLSAYTIPYILSVIITLIIHGLACFGIKDWAEFNQDENVTTIMIKLAFCGLFIMIMFYTLTVLITCCCGSMFEAIAYNLVANCLIPGTIAVFFLVFFNDLYGIDIEDYLIDCISNTSPLGACIDIENLLESDISQLFRWYLLMIVANVIYFLIAYVLYSKRKAEDVSKPFVFKMFYYITMTAITFVIISIMIEMDDTDAIAPMLFLSAIVYFICEVIANRGFRKFGWSVLRYIGTVCSVVVLCLILKGTNGFGIENRVPSASSVKSVNINYCGLYNTCDRYDYLTINDKESIKMIIDFHKDAIEHHYSGYILDDYVDDEYIYDDKYYNTYSNNTIYNDYYNYIRITYNTYLGGKISREYAVSFEQYLTLKDLSLNEKYIEKSAEDFKENLFYNRSYNEYYDENDYITKEIPVEDRKYYFDVYSKLEVNPKNYNNINYDTILELAEAYKLDLQSRTMEDIMTPDDTYCYINGYTIFSSYTNTIKFLEKNKFTPQNLETEIQSYNNYDGNECFLFAPDDITCMGGDYYTSLDGYKAHDYKAIYVDLSILPLLEVAQPNYITTDKCYMLRFNNHMYVIPKEYSDLAKEFYQGNNKYQFDYYLENTVNRYEYNYQTCYMEVHDIWKKHFTENYNLYNDFVENLMFGNVDYFIGGEYEGTISANDFDILQDYDNIYWNVYYDGYLQEDWNIWGINKYSNYDDFVWYILKYTFNQEDIDNLLFNDDEVKTTEKENPKIQDKPIDENSSNI